MSFSEGFAVIDEAIEALKNQAPREPLILDQGLVRSTWEHSKY